MKLRERAEVFAFKGSRVLANLTGTYVVLPGGGIDDGESAVQAAKREFQEEAARRLMTVTTAHPPTVQIWPDGFKMPGYSSYSGGYTHWFTGSTSEAPDEAKHPDFEPGFQWHPVTEVIEALRKNSADTWVDDAKVRLVVLRAHLAASKTAASTTFTTLFPSRDFVRLGCSNRLPTY